YSSNALKNVRALNVTGDETCTLTNTFTVTNTGNTTLTSAVINDALTNTVNLAVSPIILLPNETGAATVTYTITQSDVDAGKVTRSEERRVGKENNSEETHIY